MTSQESLSGDDFGTLFSQSIKRKRFVAPFRNIANGCKPQVETNIVPPAPTLEIWASQQSQPIKKFQNFFDNEYNGKKFEAKTGTKEISREDIAVDNNSTPFSDRINLNNRDITVSSFPAVKRKLFDNDFQYGNSFTPRSPQKAEPQASGQFGRLGFGSQQMHLETPSNASISVNCGGNKGDNSVSLRPVSEIPEKYRKIFNFPYFNVVQSKVFDDVLYSDMPLVICAPTGSGKTVLFELAIIRLLLCNALEADLEYKIVYMAPIKALCSERHKDWSTKFESCGLKCTELTGDTDMDDFHVLQYAHVVLTTPEKWDSMTRKWKDHKSLVQSVRLFLIDEVHLLSDESRGATMEAVVSRMKTVQSSITKEKARNGKMQAMRIIAVSATIPNVEDIADWLTIDDCCAQSYSMGDEYRPVTLRRVVLGYPCSENMSDFKFDLSLNYKLSGIIQTYSDCKPTLVFCSTRKGVAQAAATLSKEARFIMDSQHKSRLMKYSNTIHDAKLRDIILFGVGYHHAGMDISDRKSIESMFVRGELPVLFCTSTLAMGVNLPAHLVVIKSTMHYVVGMYEEYTESQVLQMIGRAGRPQFDTSATAVIMTKSRHKQKYQALVNGAQTIESSLHRHLIEHINAEIVLGTIPTTKMAEEWLKSTFLYKRMQKNPSHYTMGLRALRSLQSLNLLEIKEDGSLIPTDTGKLMARYCIAFNTVKSFSEVKGSESMEELVEILSKSKEFEDITLRVSEKKVLNTLNKDKHRVTIRFPMKNKIKTTDQKINCLIQAVLGCLTVAEFSLMQDIAKIFRSGQRVSRFLSEYLLMKGAHKAAMNAVILNKCIRARLWDNSKFVSRQLDKIGATMSTALVHAGLTTLEKMENINPRELEMIVGRHPPFGSQVKDALAALPKYDIAIDQDENYQKDKAELYIKLTMLNAETRSKHTKTKKTQFHHSSLFLIADASNAIVFKQRLMDSMFFKEGSWSKHITIKRAHRSAELTANLISSDYVGVDLQLSFTPNYLPGFPTYFPKENTMLDGDKTPSRCLENKENAAADSKTKRRKSCTHKCLNKDWCGHQCCKFGVAVKEVRSEKKSDQASADQTPKRPKSDQMNPKTPAKRKGTAMDGFLEKLSSKKSTLPDTPGAKRIKYPSTMRHPSEIDDDSTDDLLRSVPSSNLEMKFSYQPRKVSFKELLKTLNDGNSTASSSSSPSPTKQDNSRTPSGMVNDFQHLRSGSRHSGSFGSVNKTPSMSHCDVFGDGQFNDIDDEIQCDFSLLPDDILNDSGVTFLHKGTESLPIRNKANKERKSEKSSIYDEDDGCYQFDDDELEYELEKKIGNEWDIWSKSNTTKEINAEIFFQAGAINMGNKIDMTRHGPEFSNEPKSGMFVKMNHIRNLGETRNQFAGEKTDATKLSTTRGRSFTRNNSDIVLSRKPYLSSVNGSDQNDSRRLKQPLKGQFDEYTEGSWDADVIVDEWANENNLKEPQSISKKKKAASDERGTGIFVQQPDYYDIEDVDISDSPFCNLTGDTNPFSRRDYKPEKKKHEATERQPFKVLSRNAPYQSMSGNMGNDQGLFSPVYKRDNNCDTEKLTISSAESKTGNGVQERKTGHFFKDSIDLDESISKAAELERSLPGDWFVDESKCKEEENEFDFCDI